MMLDVADYFLYSTNLGVCENFAQRQALTWNMNMLNFKRRLRADVTQAGTPTTGH